MAEIYSHKITERWDFRGEQGEDWEGPVTCFPLGPAWGGGDFLVTRSSAARTKDKQGGGGGSQALTLRRTAPESHLCSGNI